jgi:RIO-like serine/threonine protein kinase
LMKKIEGRKSRDTVPLRILEQRFKFAEFEPGAAMHRISTYSLISRINSYSNIGYKLDRKLEKTKKFCLTV